MSKEIFLRKLKIIVGRILPRGLDNIIYEAGYDAESALATINSATITNIEEHVNENKQVLKDTVYEDLLLNDLPFKLKPGHKAIILNLPKLLEQNESKKLTGLVPAPSNPSRDQILKDSLVKKIKKFAIKCSFELDCDETSILEFRQENAVHKCRFACPLCSKKINCEHKSYWLISNLEKHLKIHFTRDIQFETVDIDSSDILAPTENVAAGQMEELNNILSE